MALVVSDFFESFPKVSSNHCFSDSSNGLLRSLRTARRSSAERPRISSSMAYRAANRSSASFATADLCASYRSKNGRRACDIHTASFTRPLYYHVPLLKHGFKNGRHLWVLD